MVMTWIVNEKSSRKRIEEDPLLGPVIGPFNIINKKEILKLKPSRRRRGYEMFSAGTTRMI